MTTQRIDLGMNEGLDVREGEDGPYIILWPLGSGPQYGNIYRVTLAELPDGRWRAQIPLMPQCSVVEETRDAAKAALAKQMMAYLHRRTAFMQDAAPLTAQHIIETPHATNGTQHGDGDRARLKDNNAPVWQIIAETRDAFSASSIGDDSLMIDPARIAATATRFRLPEDAIRAAIAYYLDHKQAIRNQIVHDRLERVDAAFAHLEAASGLSEDDLAEALTHTSDDAA